jgi:hypothetical protein
MLTDISQELIASFIRAMVMQAVSFSETSFIFHQTMRNIQEDSHLHTRLRDNLKAHRIIMKRTIIEFSNNEVKCTISHHRLCFSTYAQSSFTRITLVRLLSDDQKSRRLEVCEELIQRVRNGATFHESHHHR